MIRVRKIPSTRRSVSSHISYKGSPLAFESTLERASFNTMGIRKISRQAILEDCAKKVACLSVVMSTSTT